MSFRLYVADAFGKIVQGGYFPEVVEVLAWKKVPHIREMVFRKCLNLPHIREMKLEQDEKVAETCLFVKAYGEYRRYDNKQ